MKHAGTGTSAGRPSWRGTFRNAWKTVGEFLDLRAAEENRRLDEEVRGIVASSLAILVHKRQSIYNSTTFPILIQKNLAICQN